MKREYWLGVAFVGFVMITGVIGHWAGNTFTGCIFGAGVAAVAIAVIEYDNSSSKNSQTSQTNSHRF